MKKLLTPIFALAPLLTACSGSDDATNKEAVIKMAAVILEDEMGFYSEEYVGCMLEGLVDITGVSWKDIEQAFELDGNLENLEENTTPSPEAEEELMAMVFTCVEEANVLQYMVDDVIDNN